VTRRLVARFGDPFSLEYEANLRQRQAAMFVCCQAFGMHRFDCQAAPREQRDVGPHLPIRRPRATP